MKDATRALAGLCLIDATCAGSLVCTQDNGNGNALETLGQCACPAGTTQCGSTCIPNQSLTLLDVCCANSNCNDGVGLSCTNGQCACADGEQAAVQRCTETWRWGCKGCQLHAGRA